MLPYYCCRGFDEIERRFLFWRVYLHARISSCVFTIWASGRRTVLELLHIASRKCVRETDTAPDRRFSFSFFYGFFVLWSVSYHTRHISTPTTRRGRLRLSLSRGVSGVAAFRRRRRCRCDMITYIRYISVVPRMPRHPWPH